MCPTPTPLRPRRRDSTRARLRWGERRLIELRQHMQQELMLEHNQTQQASLPHRGCMEGGVHALAAAPLAASR